MTIVSRAALAALFVLSVACGGGGGKTSQDSGSCSGGTWVGGDAAGDADRDGLANAVECAAGTNPALADTDGDGLSDGAELSRNPPTSPTIADSDGDGLSDGQEVAAGTNPLAGDTDGDGIPDAEEIAGGTSPVLADTDADGLSDGAELARNPPTNPTVADTDGDGIKDGDEVALGLDPTVADPPTTGLCDTLAACARDALVQVQWQDRFHGDYRLALPIDAAASDPWFPDGGGRLAATAFDLDGAQIAGFVLSMDEIVANGDPTAQLNALYARLSAAIGQIATPWTATELVAGRTVTSWDGFPAVVGARVNLTATTATAGDVRKAALASLSGVAADTFGGLPAGAFGPGPYVMSLEVLSRRNAQGDAHRVVVVAAVAPRPAFDNKTLQTRIAASDLTGGTALGQSGDGDGTRCEGMLAGADARADFVWMSDVSGSTADERDPIKASTAAVFDRLAQLGIDFRMGVVRHTANHVTNEEPAGRLVSPGFTTDQATYATYWNDPGSDQGREYGLTAIDDVVGLTGTALPRSATVQATKLRQDVKLVVVYVSDEHPQEVEDACPVAKDNCRTNGGCADLTGNACVAGVIQPFIDHLVAQDAIAFGIIAPPPSGCATSYEVGFGYAELISALGGSYGSVCASDPGQTLDDIVTAVAGATSSFVLPSAPIAMTLKVVVTEASPPVCDPANPQPGRREVARSQVNGFDYDPVNNTIFFVGSSRPAAGDTVTVSYREWVEQTANPNPDPPPSQCTDCGGCQANYRCNTTTCQCEVIPG